ncbi:MAG: hypothetical protein AB4080_03310 [Trichodesmium sp.]
MVLVSNHKFPPRGNLYNVIARGVGKAMVLVSTYKFPPWQSLAKEIASTKLIAFPEA